MDKWIAKKDFQQQVEKQKEEEETTPWGDLEEGKIHLIDNIEELTSIKYRQCFLLLIKDRQGNTKNM